MTGRTVRLKLCVVLAAELLTPSVTVYVPREQTAGVPAMVAVAAGAPAEVKLAPAGNAPTEVMPVIGSTDEVVTVCVNAASSGTLSAAALVIVGAPPTVSVNVCVAFGNTPLADVKEQV